MIRRHAPRLSWITRLIEVARGRATTTSALPSSMRRRNLNPIPVEVSCAPHTFTAGIRRRGELVDLRFEFYNPQARLFGLVSSGPRGTEARAREPGDPSSRVVVVFPPQHVIERAFMENALIYDARKSSTATRGRRRFVCGGGSA
jgi:hypothetical protein